MSDNEEQEEPSWTAAYRIELSPHEWTWTHGEAAAMARRLLELERSDRNTGGDYRKKLLSEMTEREKRAYWRDLTMAALAGGFAAQFAMDRAENVIAREQRKEEAVK